MEDGFVVLIVSRNTIPTVWRYNNNETYK
jgi:hypothetical protein